LDSGQFLGLQRYLAACNIDGIRPCVI
jgi:hypothetical protein